MPHLRPFYMLELHDLIVVSNRKYEGVAGFTLSIFAVPLDLGVASEDFASVSFVDCEGWTFAVAGLMKLLDITIPCHSIQQSSPYQIWNKR